MTEATEQTSEAPAVEQPSPTQIIARSGNQVTVQDANGRVIVVEKLTALAFYKLTKALGEYASNPETANLGMLAASVRKIDANPFPMPSRETDVQLVIQMLDFPGMAAVAEGLKQLAQESEGEIEAVKN